MSRTYGTAALRRTCQPSTGLAAMQDRHASLLQLIKQPVLGLKAQWAMPHSTLAE